jgi:hypothetical protein
MRVDVVAGNIEKALPSGHVDAEVTEAAEGHGGVAAGEAIATLHHGPRLQQAARGNAWRRPRDVTVGPTPGGEVGAERTHAVLLRIGDRVRHRHRQAQPAAALLAFGPSRYDPPRHPTHFVPSFPELNGLRNKQKLAATSSKAF